MNYVHMTMKLKHVKNDIKQHHLLNLKIFEGKNTREIYAMVGQTDIYDN